MKMNLNAVKLQSKIYPLKQEHFILLSIVIFSFGVMMFLTGYFPISDYPANGIDHHPSNNRQVHRVVIMVIDALREDFVNQSRNMPYLSNLIKTKQNCCHFPTKVEVPTVTMPRVKALTTGMVPSFIDVILNFGTSEVKHDSIIHRAYKAHDKIIFYGDDTWMKLFPNKFVRSDGTTSFFVSDFTEVDNNVTRHLKNDLEVQDWDIMILHYLGLDHIGHLHGPKSSLIGPKLQEMDQIVKFIHNQLLSWEKRSMKKSLFVVTADHGMEDGGGHGGHSYAEVIVPFITIGIPCKSHNIQQIDIAPTLSVLLNLPYPSSSIGTLIPGLLEILSPIQSLKTLRSYYTHLRDLVETSCGSREEVYLESNERFRNNFPKSIPDNITTQYSNLRSFLLNEMSVLSQHLISKRTHFDMNYIWLSVVILWSTTVAMLQHSRGDFELDVFKNYGNLVILKCVLLLNGIHIGSCFTYNEGGSLCSLSIWPMVFIATICIGINFFIVLSYKSQSWCPTSNIVVVMIIAQLGQIFSLAANSYIEEEHLSWYFYTSSILIYILYKYITNTNLKTLEAVQSLLEWSILIILNRILREWNYTVVDIYNKYTTDNISTWLNEISHINTLTVIYIAGLALVSFTIKLLFDVNIWVYGLVNLNLVLIYLYRSATGTVLSFMKIEDHSGVVEAWAAYICIILVIITFIVSQMLKGANSIRLQATTIGWILLISLLLRPHNLPLIMMLAFISYKVCQIDGFHLIKIIVHFWLGKQFYFYQGTTNNISTIDITSGYIGQTSYNPIIVGLLILCHTYAMPVLSHLLLLMDVTKNYPTPKTLRSKANKMYAIYLLLTFLSVSYYSIIMIIQREHLFTWTVFSPKLMFDCVYTLVIFICIILSEFFVIQPQCDRFIIKLQ